MHTGKVYDLEDRTTKFAILVVKLCRNLRADAVNQRLISQLVGSSGSIGANYREANDALGKRDFLNRLRIARKEAKETIHWLAILNEANPTYSDQIEKLTSEATELRNILSAIITSAQNKV